MTGVADQHRVIQLLVRDGQLQMTTVFTEHVATVPDGGREDYEVMMHDSSSVICN